MRLKVWLGSGWNLRVSIFEGSELAEEAERLAESDAQPLKRARNLSLKEQYPTLPHPSKPCLDFICFEISMTCSLDLINPSLCLSIVTSSSPYKPLSVYMSISSSRERDSLKAQTHI